MGTRESYAPGVFCWVDLATTDPAAAKRFYEALFGWEYDDRDAGDGRTYTIAASQSGVVAGIEGVDGDGPPSWRSYVAVTSADETAQRALAAGAEIVVPPTDAGPAGRTATLKDPTGALVSVWEARDRPGAEVVNEPGAVCWNDLMTHDVTRAADFYREVFDWELAPVEGAPGHRQSIRVGATLNGGVAELPEELGAHVPPHWLACFAVGDVGATRQAVDDNGGRAVTDVVVLPTGRFAVVADPLGAAFGIIDGEMDS